MDQLSEGIRQGTPRVGALLHESTPRDLTSIGQPAGEVVCVGTGESTVKTEPQFQRGLFQSHPSYFA